MKCGAESRSISFLRECCVRVRVRVMLGLGLTLTLTGNFYKLVK